MTIIEGVKFLRMFFPNQYCFVSHESVAYSGCDEPIEYFKAYTNEVWSAECKTVEEAVFSVCSGQKKNHE